MAEDIRFAIIGHGFMGHEHEKMLSDFPGIKLVGIADRDPEQLKDVKEGIKRYSSNEELFADPEVTVHQQRRYDPDFRTAKEVYDSGTLGKVYAIKNQLYGFNGNMHDWHVLISEGGGMLYDWGVHLLDQVCWMFPGAKLKSVFADIRNVINTEVDDYFQIMLKFDNDVTATVELGTYYLADKVQDKWFERHWFVAGDKGTAYVDGFFPEGKIVRTTSLLTNVGGKRTMTAAGPTRSFGPAPEGRIATEPLPEVHTEHRNYFENYVKAYHGEEEFLVQIPEVRRILKLMDAIRESGRTGKSIDFE